MTRIEYTEEQKRRAITNLVRNAAFESRNPQPAINGNGDPISDPFAGAEFDVRTSSDYWMQCLTRALTQTDALFVLERIVTEEN